MPLKCDFTDGAYNFYTPINHLWSSRGIVFYEYLNRFRRQLMIHCIDKLLLFENIFGFALYYFFLRVVLGRGFAVFSVFRDEDCLLTWSTTPALIRLAAAAAARSYHQLIAGKCDCPRAESFYFTFARHRYLETGLTSNSYWSKSSS